MSSFPPNSSARVVATPIESRDLARIEQPSLFIAVSRSGEHSSEFDEPAVSHRGYIDEVGFAAHWAEPLSALPPRHAAFFGEFMRDRFFWVESGDCGRDLARLEIDETLAEDTYMRGSVDYTGFIVGLTLGAQAYRNFADLVEIGKPITNRSIVLSLPTPPFAFPAQRGRPTDPYSKITVKDLQPIKRLEVSEITVAVVNRRWPYDGDSILDRFEIHSATKLTFAS